MRRITFYWWLTLFLLFSCAFAKAVMANELHVLDLREFSLDVFKIQSNYVGHADYTQPDRGGSGETWRGGVAANFDLDILMLGDYGLRWDNTVHTEGTDSQVRTVGWEWKAALQLGPKLDLYYYHHSQHIMDAPQPMDHFPLQDYYGVRFNLYQRGEK